MMVMIALLLACGDASVGGDSGSRFWPGEPVSLEDADDLAVGNGWVCASDTRASVDCDGFDAPAGDWYTVDGDWGTLCAVGVGNEGRCWGDVEANPGRVEQIAAGDGFACWLRLDVDGGELECEGGIASPPSGSDWMDLSAGGDTACALSDDGAVTCWGGRDFTDGSGWDRVTVGPTGDLCALQLAWQSNDYDVRCWGLSAPDAQPLGYRVTLGMGGGYLESETGDPVPFGGAPAPYNDEDLAWPLWGIDASEDLACGILDGGAVHCWDR